MSPAVYGALIIALLCGAEPTEPATPERTVVPNTRIDRPTDVLDRDRLGEVAGTDLAGALDSQPGLTVNRLGGLGMFSTVSIRGSTPEQVLVALDGIPLNPADGAPVDLSSLPLGPLNSIDLYRGRSPWSLGMTGLGGAIVLHSRTPDSLTADAELTLGAFETFGLRGFVGDEVDDLELSLAVDGLHTRSNFRFTNDGGTAWTTDDDVSQTRTNAAADQLSVLGRAALHLGDARLTLVDLYTLTTRGLPSLGVTPTRESSIDLHRNVVALRLDVPGRLRIAATGWLAYATTTVYDPLGEIGLGSGTRETTSTVPGVAVSLQYPTTTLTPSLHLSWRHESTTALARHVAALAAEARWRPSRFELAAGIRGELSTDSSLGLYFEATHRFDHLRLTFGARRSPRLPSLFELHGDSGLVLGNPDLSPESATTLELGVRWDPSPRFGLGAFAYATWADDLIQFIQNAQGVTRFENLATARILGVELQLEATLTSDLHLRSSVTFMDARDTSDIAARTGKRLPLRPAFATSHRLELRHPDPTLGGALGAYLEADVVAGNHLDFANLVAIPVRTLIGAGLFLRTDRFEVLLSVSNLLDDRVQDFAGYPLPGITTMLSLRLGSP